MKTVHPYTGKPDHQFWRRAAAGRDGADLDPVTDIPFKIDTSERIVTAGSCFAQHVARHLSAAGFNHFITEPAHPLIPEALAQKHNYGMFSARYGNIYTARQLLQLLQRAYGLFTPCEEPWVGGAGEFVDPFRPQIQPGGYRTQEEMLVDRRQHLAAVRRAVESLDVFVFTLGLTEAWIDRCDGAVLPLAPGVAGGSFDSERYEFRNFDDGETSDDLEEALTFLRRRRGKDVKIILTVSPVPLNATYEDRHVWSSTVWSKAVLRIAAERVARNMSNCCYFPSYEVITSPHVRGRYFASDGREVLMEGVEHVMGLFTRHFTESPVAPREIRGHDPSDEAELAMREMEDLIEVLCDEAAIDSA